MSERYIAIRNWSKFQHYKDNTRPPWIKAYTELLHDDAWLNLTNSQRGVLLGLWLEYASNGQRVLHEDTTRRHLSTNKAESRHYRSTIDSLHHAGFIDVGSREALEELYSRRRSRERIEPPSSPPTQRKPTEAEIVQQREEQERNGYVPNLSSYTGCRIVRGEVGVSHIYDPLGTEPKPFDWPYLTPTRQEIAQALMEQTHA